MDVFSCTAMWGDEESNKREEGLVNAVSKVFFKAVDPPPQNLCGTDGGPPVTARRIKLRDGRHLAYAEFGVPKEKAKYKIVFSHGFTGSRNDCVKASQLFFWSERHFPACYSDFWAKKKSVWTKIKCIY